MEADARRVKGNSVTTKKQKEKRLRVMAETPATRKDDVLALISARKEDDACLTFTYGSESRLQDGARTEVTLPLGHKLTVDEENSMPGGKDSGVNACEVFACSLGTCQEITYKLYATVMEVPLKSVSATVTGDIDLRGFVGVGDSKVGMEEVSVDIALDAPDASDEQLQALKGAVDAHCPLVETIRNPLQIETIFKKVEPKSAKAVDAQLKDGILARIAASKDDENALKMKYTSTSKLAGPGLRTDVKIRHHSVIVDEPQMFPAGLIKGQTRWTFSVQAFQRLAWWHASIMLLSWTLTARA